MAETRKEQKANYFPDVAVQRRTLEEAIRQARHRWFQLEQERKARLKVSGAAKAGGAKNVPAVAFMENAAEQLKGQIDVRLAQVLGELQQFEAEIDTHMEALKALPDDDEMDETVTSEGDSDIGTGD